MAKTRTVTVRCPCCAARLEVDVATGEVLAHRAAKAPPAGGKSFDELLGGLDQQKEEAEDVFQKEMKAMEDQERLMDEKFKRALERAKDLPDDEPPPSPFDFD